MLAMLEKTGIPFIICFTPEEKRAFFVEWLGEQHVYLAQKGGHLGERMQKAFEEVFSDGYGCAVLIGSDLPDLPSEILDQAIQSLETFEAVIGPARDGGYYLIGFRRSSFSPAAFFNIPWGTKTVLKDTLSLLKKESEHIFILPAWRDVDTLEDLMDLLQRTRETGSARSRTMEQFARLSTGSKKTRPWGREI
jgi:rSAM/selenodomain-associated transferase 1